MKKIAKIAGIIVLILIILLISLPFIFGGTIKEKIKVLANQNVNALVDFKDVDISLFSSFPKASVRIDELSLINKAPFEGDTLAAIDQMVLTMGITELFKSQDEAITVEKIEIDKADIRIKIDSLGKANYDIAKTNEDTPDQKSSDNKGFTFDLNHYEINQSSLIYVDKVTKTFINLTNFNHEGDGTVAGSSILLQTHSDTDITFDFDKINYLKNNKLVLDALIEMDLETQKYTFRENEAKINQLPLTFNGYVQLFDTYTDVDLSFKTPSSDFRNFLAVIPEVYAKNIENVKTTGNFAVNGTIKGKSDDTYIPKIKIAVKADNASFKYPDLPKSVDNISIDALLANDTGFVKDTYATLNNLTFKIAEDTFTAKGSFKNLTENILVALQANGALNLSNLNQVYPLKLEQKLNGFVKANLHTNFDMNALEKEQYEKVKSAGTITLSDFAYSSPEIPNEVKIDQAEVNFEPGIIRLKKMTAKTGNSDLTAIGTIENMLGFVFTDQKLKGNFDVTSAIFEVNDFMIPENSSKKKESKKSKPESSTTATSLKIPSFLDATLNFKADKVKYDNIELSNAKGSVIIKDETAKLSNVTSNLFNGSIAFDGKVDTKSEVPTFGMNLDLSKIDITKSFSQMELLKGLAPIAKALTGILNTKLSLNGNLSSDLTPVLKSLKGNAVAEILNAKVNKNASPLLSNLNGKLNFLDLDNLNLKDIKTNLNFNDGKINVKPFSFDVKGIKIQAGGSHSFESQMDYNIVMDVPAKYFGSEISGLITNLNKQDLENTVIPLPIGLTGTFSNPSVKVNPGDAIKDLTQQIIAEQKNEIKEKVTNQVKEKTGNVIGGLLGNKSKAVDSTTTHKQTDVKAEDKLKDAAKDVLGGLLNRNKKKKDSTDQK